MIALHTSKTTPLGGRRFALDAGIGARWHSVDGGPFIETDPTLVNIGGIWQLKAAPYGFRFGADKARRIYPDKTNPGRYMHLPMPAILQGINPVVVGNEISFTAPNGFFRVIIATGLQGMSFRVVFNREPPFQSIRLPVDTMGGLDILALLKATSGLGIPKPRLVDANGVERPLTWKYAAGELSLDLDFSGLTFPVTLYNTTLDLQIGASADDATVRWSDSLWAIAGLDYGHAIVGYSVISNCKFGSGLRFLNVTIAPGSTIDIAYLTLQCSVANSNTIVNSRITGDKEANAATWTTLADYQARRGTIVGGADNTKITTAQVDWDGIAAWAVNDINNSPSIISVAQEIIDQGGWASGNALVFWWDDHDARGTQADTTYRAAYSYDGSTTKAPKLHIEYTAGGGQTFLRYVPAAGQRTLLSTATQMKYDHNSGQRTMLSTAPKSLEYDTSNAGVKAS